MALDKPNYTQVPNIFFDEIMRKLSFPEMSIMLIIIRNTFGWHKEKDRISYSQLMEKTGISGKPTISKALKSLIEKDYIKAEKTGQKVVYSVSIKDESEESKPVQNMNQFNSLTETGSKNEQVLLETGSKNEHTKEININKMKDIISTKVEIKKMPSINSKYFRKYSDNAYAIEYMTRIVKEYDVNYAVDSDLWAMKKLIQMLRKIDDTGKDVFHWELFIDKWNIYTDDKFWADKGAKNIAGLFFNFNKIAI